jgi:hypothetical protein
MKWKIYFLLYTLFNIFAGSDYFRNLNWSFNDILCVISISISEVGLFAFAFKKELFSVKFWKYAFWAVLILDITTIIYAVTPLNQIPFLQTIYHSNVYSEIEESLKDPFIFIFVLVFMLLFIPSYYALYQLGHPKSKSSSHKK